MAFIMRSALLSLEICIGINKPVDKGDLVDTDCHSFKNVCQRVRRNQASMEGPSTIGKYSSSIFPMKSKQEFKRGLCWDLRCSVYLQAI